MKNPLARLHKIDYPDAPRLTIFKFVMWELILKYGNLRAELTCLVLVLALAVATHWAVYNHFDHKAAGVRGAACPVTFKS